MYLLFIFLYAQTVFAIVCMRAHLTYLLLLDLAVIAFFSPIFDIEIRRPSNSSTDRSLNSFTLSFVFGFCVHSEYVETTGRKEETAAYVPEI